MTMWKLSHTFAFAFITAVLLHGQVSGLKYSGSLIDAIAETPIAGATVTLTNDLITFEAITDDGGKFVFRDLLAGTYQLSFRSLGYLGKSVAEVEINTGISREQVFRMEAAGEALDEIVVKAESRRRSGEAINSIYTLTVEETFRYPGTFYDPARLATHYAGVINENDQANNLVVRGNSPNGVAWFLQGAEIVNPNHLSNAGTQSDRPSQSGGGVNVLSAQMLGNSTFLTGAFPAPYGNAISGIMDMQLRNGTSTDHRFTAQIGLLGIDVASEGPLSKNLDNSSFLVNYRYSTIGLLSAMGVDLGDEAISFQDLSFHTNWDGENGTYSFFGLGGISKNIFTHKDGEDREEFKDIQNITYEGRVGALGFQFHNRKWEHTMIASGYNNDRSALLPEGIDNLVPFEKDIIGEQRMGLHSRRKMQLPEGLGQIGVRVNSISYHLLTDWRKRSFDQDTRIFQEYKRTGFLLEAYGEIKKSISKRLKYLAGLHFTTFTLNQGLSIEPRLGLSLQSTPRMSWSFSYGLHSRIPPAAALLFTEHGAGDNSDLKLMKSHHFVLGNRYRISHFSQLITEVYYQSLYNIPIAPGSDRSFSPINTLDYFLPTLLESEGTGENMGIELSYQRYFTKGTYFLLTGSVYDSKYVGGDGARRNTRYNGRFGFNLTGGKEFEWQKNNKLKIIGINLRSTYFGGFWEGPIDLESSDNFLRTIYREDLAFTEQLPNFFKMDFRIYIKRIKPKFTSILGLDLLNATNQENTAYKYFDPLTKKIKTKYHLGILPNLSYRIEF